MAMAGGMVIRPILQHNRETAVQWRTAPGGRGIPSHGITGAGEGDVEVVAELEEATAEGREGKGEDLVTNSGDGELKVGDLEIYVSLDLEGYVTYRATMYIHLSSQAPTESLTS